MRLGTHKNFQDVMGWSHEILTDTESDVDYL